MTRLNKSFFSIILCLILITLLFTGSFQSAFAGTSKPSLEGSAAIVYCGTTNETLYSKEIDTQYNLASITKLMTCLLAVEKLGLDYEVKVDAEATNITKEQSAVYADEIITVRDLCYEALLVSANDAAKALGLAVSGSEKKFAKLMNERALKIGCTNTKFHNASGVANNGNKSTAHDIALIAKEALSNPDIRKIAGTSKYTVPATNKSEALELTSTNLFLDGGSITTSSGKITVDKYKGVFGGKTGTTDTGKTTMVVGCDFDGLETYVVILNSTTHERYNDIAKLLKYAKENLNPYDAVKKGDVVGQAKVPYGAVNRVDAVAETQGVINLPEGASASLVTLEPNYDKELKAPITAGQKIGTLDIYLADEKIRTINLVAQEDVVEGWFLSAFGISNFTTIIIGLVLVAILCLFVFILRLRAINRKRRAKRRKEQIRQQAIQQMKQEADWAERGWPNYTKH